MEDKEKLIESLLERTVEYGNTSIKLVKLQALDKTSDVFSTLIPNTIVLFLIVSILFFFNFGLAFWLGEILGNTYLGFFVVAGFYVIIAFVIHFFMHNWLKKVICDSIIKHVLN